MPDLTPEQRDAMDEAIMRQLYRIHKVAEKAFGAGFLPEELRRAHQRIKQGTQQVLEQQQPDQVGGFPRNNLGAEADPRNALFRSNVPPGRMIGPARPVDQIQEEGFTGAMPLITDPRYIEALRRSRLGAT